MKKQWWQNFQIMAYVVGGLAALLTVIVVANKYIVLPEKVEAEEKKNAEQDKLLDRLTIIQEQNQKLITNQIENSKDYIQEQDYDGDWWCCKEDTPDICYKENTWYRC